MMLLGRLFLVPLLIGIVAATQQQQQQQQLQHEKRDIVLADKIARGTESAGTFTLTNTSTLASILNGTGSATGGDDDGGATNTTTATGATCDMLANISQNQQVSWTSNFIQTCCSDSMKTTCFYRVNDDGSDSVTVKANAGACFQIPSCLNLIAGNNSTMAGFQALASTLGSGDLQNEYKYKFAANGAHIGPNLNTITCFTVALVAIAQFIF